MVHIKKKKNVGEAMISVRCKKQVLEEKHLLLMTRARVSP